MADSFSQADVQVLKRQTCFQGFYRLDRLTLQHRQFRGGLGPVLTRELFVRPDAVCVLPYDPVQDAVVLVEQFRVGALQKSTNPWLLEVVAGLIEPGEQPEQVAYREAQEEAGLTLTALWPVCSYYPSPGGSDERVHLFIGRCDSSQAEGVHGLPSEGEDIRVQVYSRIAALTALSQGSIDNAATLLSLQWLALHQAQLVSAWTL